MNTHNQKEILQRLTTIYQRVSQDMRAGHFLSCDEILSGIRDVKADIERHLPATRRAYYAEILDGCESALRQAEPLPPSDCREIMALCGELIEQTAKDIAKEPVKKDIVFLPYKASMWDSMESVWRAASEDKEHCNVYVVPIPYVTRNPDGSPAKWHCEIAEFPKYVPVRAYQSIDLAAMHPDVIVIHSPYDDENKVTSVAEEYYSRNLKPLTDKLVYIPYFILDEIEPGNEEAEKSIAHLVLYPGVYNADVVIVQSEKMREVYIHILTKYTNQKERSFWEPRILGLGSPKIDKVLASKREDFPLPEKWKRLINGRKVILYNTSLLPLSECPDKACAKLRFVFDTFRDRSDVALWWRPHPLAKDLLHSMKPEYEKEYREIEAVYIHEGWGIYDDSPELYRAIAWSDAYYGDRSSIVELYRSIGKPMIIQNVRMCNDLYFYDISTACMGQGGIWLIFNDLNSLFYYDFKSKHLKLIKHINQNKLFQYMSYRNILKYGQMLFIIPFLFHDGFYIYDLVKNVIRMVPLEHYDIPNDAIMFGKAITYKDKVYLVGIDYPALVEYDTVTEELKYYHEFVETLKQYVDVSPASKNDRHYFLDGVCCENSLYMPFCCGNIVVEFHLELKKFIYHSVGKKENRYCGIIFDGNRFWLKPVKPGLPLVCWEPTSGYCREYGDYPDGYDISWCKKLNQDDFRGVEYRNGKVYLFPHRANMLLEVDVQSGKMNNCEGLSSKLELEKILRYSDRGEIFSRVQVCGEYVYASCPGTETLYSIDLNRQEIQGYKIGITRRLWEEILQRSRASTLRENDLLAIVDLPMAFQLASSSNTAHDSRHTICGRDIYEYMLRIE